MASCEKWVVGIDPSLTATGLAAISAVGDLTVQTFGTEPHDYNKTVEGRYQRFSGICDHVDLFLLSHQAELVVIEGYSFASHGSASSKLVELGAMIRDTCLRRCATIEVPPSRLKLFAARNGKASKQEVIEAIRAEFGLIDLNEHESDAMACAWLAGAIQGYFTPNIQRQREIAEECCTDLKV